MRKLLMGLVLFFALGGTLLAWPYRSEEIVGIANDNRTGCTINVEASSGQVTDFPVPGLHRDRLKEPITAGVAVYECGGVVGTPPAAMVLLVPGTNYRAEGCASHRDSNVCYVEFPAVPAAAGRAPHRYRLLIRPRPGGPIQAVDLSVTRQEIWRSATFDALMSV